MYITYNCDYHVGILKYSDTFHKLFYITKNKIFILNNAVAGHEDRCEKYNLNEFNIICENVIITEDSDKIFFILLGKSYTEFSIEEKCLNSFNVFSINFS